MQLSAEQQGFLLDVARAAIRQTLRGSPAPCPASNDPAMNAPAGCFVSLHDRFSHRLRGCVGRLQSPEALLRNIHQSAASVLGDPRFRVNPVTLPELPRLEVELSVLSPMKLAQHPLDFDLLTDGIYMQAAARAGTFLPQVARQTGWTKEQLLARLCTEKMGLSEIAWKEPGVKLYTYTAAIIGPVPFEPM